MEFLQLPHLFHLRLAHFMAGADPHTRQGYSMTCRYLWNLVESGGDYDAYFASGDETCHSLIIQGRGADCLTFRNYKFPEATSNSVGIRHPALPQWTTFWPIKTSDVKRLDSACKTADGKYTHILLRVRTLTPRLLRFINTRVHKLSTGDVNGVTGLYCPVFYITALGRRREHIVWSMIAQWQAGNRRIIKGVIRNPKMDTDPEFRGKLQGDHVYMNGERTLRVRVNHHGNYLLEETTRLGTSQRF
ncbi:unnamed protein product, partial [Mesorhabditis spiculigera]